LLTLNQIHAQIVALANAHYQIAEVGMGTIAELQGKPDRLYPLLWLSNEGGSLEDNYKVDNIRLTMFGRVIVGEEGQDDDASEIEVLSDMQLILLDFLNYFHQQHGQEYVTDKAATLEHFTERTNDRTAGYSCVLELKQFYDWNKCNIPQSGAVIPPTIDGLTLYDFCDQSVLDRLTAEQNACLLLEFGNCADATVENSDASYSATVASGGTLVVPNTPISANGDLVINQPSTIAKDVVVRYETQGTVLTTIVGGDVVVPDVAAAGGTISVSTSNAAPSFLDSITLTATVTGITATGYILQYPDKFGNLVETASQLSNVFVVNAKNVGADNYYIVATDGTNEIIGEVSVTTTVNIPIINGKKVLSFWKLISAYAGSWVRVRRFSDNSELDIPYTNGRGDIAALRTFVGNTGFAVTIYYDQAANGNATQTTTANQPDFDGDGFVWMSGSIRLASAMTSGYSSGQTSTDHLVFRSLYPAASNQRVMSHLPINKRFSAIGSFGTNVVTIVAPSLSTNSVALDIQKVTQHTMEIKDNSMQYWADGVQVINDTSQTFTAQATTGMDYFSQSGSFPLVRGANLYAHVSYANDRIATIDNILQELIIND
jgi:hypothetical protein